MFSFPSFVIETLDLDLSKETIQMHLKGVDLQPGRCVHIIELFGLESAFKGHPVQSPLKGRHIYLSHRSIIYFSVCTCYCYRAESHRLDNQEGFCRSRG